MQRLNVDVTTRWSPEEISMLCEDVRRHGVQPSKTASLIASKTESHVDHIVFLIILLFLVILVYYYFWFFWFIIIIFGCCLY